MNRDFTFWNRAAEKIQYLIDRYGEEIKVRERESVAEAKQFLDHDEYEWALEILLHEILSLEIVLTNEEIETYYCMGQELGLDSHQNFDTDLWIKFNNYRTKHRKKTST